MAVFIGSIPNTEEDDIKLAREILKDKDYSQGSLEKLKVKFSQKTFWFNRGRESLSFFLSLLNLEPEDEVITQSFTCIAAVAPILWNKAKPIYIDIDASTFNMDLTLFRKKLSEKTRVVIVQHTFGNITEMHTVREIVNKENSTRENTKKIYIIEDCAHLFPVDFSNFKIGEYSDASFFSFSQDKSISCTQGSLLVFQNAELEKIAVRKYEKLEKVSGIDALYNPKYILIWDKIKKHYFKNILPFNIFPRLTLGKLLLLYFRLTKQIYKQASQNTIEKETPKQMSDIQAKLLLNQLGKIDRLNKKRMEISQKYYDNLKDFSPLEYHGGSLLRFPLLVSNREEVKRRLGEKKIITGIWYSSPVFPLHEDSDLKKVFFLKRDYPRTMFCCENVINLPTNIEVTDLDIESIVDVVRKFAKPVKF